MLQLLQFDSRKDFTTYFKCSLGSLPNVIDVLTIMHQNLSFDEAEKQMNIHKLSQDLNLNFVSYEMLKNLKLYSKRPKDLWDLTQLEKLRNQSKK